MFQYSGRLAGLDSMVLKISTPSEIASAISKCALDSEPYLKVKNVPKRKVQRTTRPPLTDKTFVNKALPNAPSYSQRKSLEKSTISKKSRGQQGRFLPPDKPVILVRRSQHHIESFHPLPHLPSASTLQLPSFLNFSTTLSLNPSLLANQCPQSPESSHSLPGSVLFHRSSSHVSVRPVIIRKTKNAKVYEGPQWIPAFHHPNSPYVPWSSPIRRDILRPLTPESSIPSPLHSRSGAVAPEPWCSHFSTETQANVEKRSSSWKSFMKSIRSGLKSVKSSVSRMGNVRRFSRRRAEVSKTNCGNGLPAGDCVFSEENPRRISSNPSESRMSLGSIASSDSNALGAWLAERYTISDTSCDCPGMSLEEYEMMGSWLDLRRGLDGDWTCGVPDCDIHTRNESLGALCHTPRFVHTTIPFDATVTPVSKQMTLPVDNSSPLPCCSPPQSLSQTAGTILGDPSAESLLRPKKSRELNMPGGWMFRS